MPFNSIEFLVLFLITFGGYWLVKKSIWQQNLLILIGSYFFYGWFNHFFLIILFAVSLTGYIGGNLIQKSINEAKRKSILIVGIVLIGGCLASMKYYNFFIDSIAETASFFSYEIQLSTIKLFLPIGLSYYVFQSIGYLVDVYRRKSDAETNILTYFAYVSFFPSILSGPIAQSTVVLPQFSKKRTLDIEKIKDGLELIIWGLFKKVVVADSLAVTVNYVFARHEDLSGSVLVVGIALYSFQLYADFSGYSQMAQGFGKLLGFELMQNFKYPYFSRSVGEFWRNWHRSLSAWMRDYIYVPLGGRGTNKFIHARNILLTFTFSGLWHGASWNFVIWGFLNGLYMMPSIFSSRFKRYTDPIAANRYLPSIREFSQMVLTFTLISFSRIFFRTPDLHSAFGFFQTIFSRSLFSMPDISFAPCWTVLVLLAVEWVQCTEDKSMEISKLRLAFRYPAYAGMLIAVMMAFSHGTSKEYLYFKF